MQQHHVFESLFAHALLLATLLHVRVPLLYAELQLYAVQLLVSAELPRLLLHDELLLQQRQNQAVNLHLPCDDAHATALHHAYALHLYAELPLLQHALRVHARSVLCAVQRHLSQHLHRPHVHSMMQNFAAFYVLLLHQRFLSPTTKLLWQPYQKLVWDL